MRPDGRKMFWNMLYRFKVTLSGIKGFHRIYEMGGETTLYDFHKQMRSDMEFPQDQLIMFKGLDPAGSVVGRFGLFDLGFGTVDVVTVDQAAEAGVIQFQYFYDVLNKKSVFVTMESVEDCPAGRPLLVDVKGPNPIEFENGYVAFEDLPDSQRHLPGQKPDWSLSSDPSDAADDIDLDDPDGPDDDEEDDDDEDGKIVFDGTEDLEI